MRFNGGIEMYNWNSMTISDDKIENNENQYS
jgi:hypothetical protein